MKQDKKSTGSAPRRKGKGRGNQAAGTKNQTTSAAGKAGGHGQSKKDGRSARNKRKHKFYRRRDRDRGGSTSPKGAGGGEPVEVSGVLELPKSGRGRLRQAAKNYACLPNDPVVPQNILSKWGLRGGEILSGKARRGRHADDPPEMTELVSINDRPAEQYAEIQPFGDLTVVSPSRRLRFETKSGPTSMRIVDLLTPVGFGQRALIVAPPRSGKTVLLHQMATAVAINHPELYTIVLLVDERPEEVTEIRRSVHGEVVASSNDHDLASHVRIARLVTDYAKRRVEMGQDVLILLDSLTRIGRAFNAFLRGTGRIMSGGLDAGALIEPKGIFGAARTIEHGGSLTIIASVLVETGSRMDEVIFNEFKGTGNMEIMLSRNMANKRIWPAIDIAQSGTRKEELLLDAEELKKSHEIRRAAASRPPDMMMTDLIDRMAKYEDNRAFVAT